MKRILCAAAALAALGLAGPALANSTLNGAAAGAVGGAVVAGPIGLVVGGVGGPLSARTPMTAAAASRMANVGKAATRAATKTVTTMADQISRLS